MRLPAIRGGRLLCEYGVVPPSSAVVEHILSETATQRRIHKKERGFTLVEILASLLFLAIAVPAIVGALGVASRTAEVAERSSLAGNLAENKLNEMLVDNAWQGAAQTNGDFGTDFPSYRWQMTTQAWTATTATAANTNTTSASAAGSTGTGTMTELAVEVFYPVQGNEHSVRLTTLVSATSTTTTTPTTGASSSTTTTR